jgi:hypothetical protein
LDGYRFAATSAFSGSPTAKGKIVAEVELFISPDYNVIETVFQDKTSLTFQS